MNRREVLRGVGLTATGGLSGLGGCARPTAEQGGAVTSSSSDTVSGTYRNPVFEPVLADPTVVRGTGGWFYVYGTTTHWHDGSGRQVVPVLRSRDLVGWEHVGAVFEDVPQWLDGANSVWAPHVVSFDGRYHLYYSLVNTDDFPDGRGIGVATAEHPTGPFTDHGAVVRSEQIGVSDSIDPAILVEDGTPTLV
jgi:arabinan endo-1,5-alpha-L-arabinosidase